jgi:hypothetical protein
MRSSPGTLPQSLIPRDPFDLSSAYSNWLANKNKKPEELSLEEEIKNKYVEDLYKEFQAKEPSYNYSPMTVGIGGGLSQELVDRMNKERELRRLAAFRGYLEKYIPRFG